jgi:membrane protease subunit HflK
MQEAQAYRQEAVARATGEAERFKTILAEYTKAQDVTTRRLYLETMEQVLKGVNKVIIDGKQGANGVVPYLPLPELERRAREQQPQAGSQGVSQ